MSELQKIIQLFDELQNGDCWIGLNMQQVLSGVDARLAANKPSLNHNSIWQLVNHLVYWRRTVAGRVTGVKTVHTVPDMYLPEDLSEANWQDTLQQFEAAYQEFRKTITEMDESNLNTPSPKKGQTYYQLLMGSLQHDCYHMGQMVVLKKS
jgi:uncharacterized damage-inducible protein DinB